MMNFVKSMLGLFGGAAAGLFAAIALYWFGEYRCAMNGDPIGHGAIVITFFSIPFLSFVGAIMGCKIAELYFAKTPFVAEIQNSTSVESTARPKTVWTYLGVFGAAVVFVILISR